MQKQARRRGGGGGEGGSRRPKIFLAVVELTERRLLYRQDCQD